MKSTKQLFFPSDDGLVGSMRPNELTPMGVGLEPKTHSGNFFMLVFQEDVLHKVVMNSH